MSTAKPVPVARIPAETMELSVSEAFASMMKDEEYRDVSLKGSDGELVPANRMALSIRSPYFEKMFKKGGFQEATKSVIPIAFDSKILRAIVEYIHTDTASILVSDGSVLSCELAADAMADFQGLVSLTEAASYVGLPGLCKKAQKSLASHMKSNSSIAFSILAASKQNGPVISDELINQAWSVFTGMTRDLHGLVLSGVSAPTLTAILQDAITKIDSTKIFNLCHSWSKCEPLAPGETKEERISAAKVLVEGNVELEFIDPEALENQISSSGLVTNAQLLSALMKQAKRAKHDHNVSFYKPCFEVGPTKWKKSKTVISAKNPMWRSDSMKGPPFVLGRKYCWTVVTNSASKIPSFWIGVTKSTHDLEQDSCGGNQAECWGIRGTAWTPSSSTGTGTLHRLGDAAKFGRGSSRVTLTLDLLEGNADNGTLWISVDGGAATKALSNLRVHLVGTTASFVPAVSCLRGSATILDVQFLH